MQTGSVKFYNIKKGFGFIVKEDDGEDIFFHVSGLTRDEEERLVKPKGGENVEFDVQDSDKGPLAINIKFLD